MTDAYDQIIASFAHDSCPMPYSRDDFSALYEAIASTRPDEVRSHPSDDDPDYDPDHDYWIYSDEQLILNVVIRAAALFSILQKPFENRTLLEQAQDNEDEAKRIDRVIRDLNTDRAVAHRNLQADAGEIGVTENTLSELVAHADGLRKEARYLRDRANLRPKGKRNPAYHYLESFLHLWECSGRKVGRTNGTAQFLEAAAAPLWGDIIKGNSVDNYLRKWVAGDVKRMFEPISGI